MNRDVVEFGFREKRYLFSPETLAVAMPDAGDSAQEPTPNHAPSEVGGINFITLNIAHDCNMACPYCFAKQGLYGGEREMMTEETARRSVDWLLRESGAKADCYLRFLGGEPFLNLRVMRDTMSYANEVAARSGKKVHFSVNTNGTLFNSEIQELFEQFKLRVSISIDGTREAHNVHRIFRSGRGTYDVVVDNVDKFLASDPTAMVNGTITSSNLNIYDYIVEFRRLGFRSIRFALVGTADAGVAVRREELLESLRVQYDRVADKYLSDVLAGDVWYFADFYKYFEGLRYRRRRGHRCGAGTTYANVDVSGSVHLCHRFTADKTQVVGNIVSGTNVDESILVMNQLRKVMPSMPSGSGAATNGGLVSLKRKGGARAPQVRSNAAGHHQLDGANLSDFMLDEITNPCAVCDIRALCGGSCFHDGETLFGDLHGGPDVFKCEVDRHLAKTAIWLVDHIAAGAPAAFARLEHLHRLGSEHRK